MGAKVADARRLTALMEFALALFVLITVTGCARLAPPTRVADSISEADAKSFESKVGMARFYITRSFLPLVSANIIVNNVAVGRLSQEEFMILELKPGAYNFQFYWSGSSISQRSYATYELAGGDVNLINLGFGMVPIVTASAKDDILSRTLVLPQVDLALLRPLGSHVAEPASTAVVRTTTQTATKPDRTIPSFKKATVARPDDIAVIIGNSNYARQGKDIPDVRPAHADAEEMRRYAIEALGIREGNVIFLKDATVAQMTGVFGSDKDHRGQLYDWVKSGRSRVFIYYAGHGAPGGQGGGAYLVPADADAARIALLGYPLKLLYGNLGKLPAENVTVVLEACFSGVSQGGTVVTSASPIHLEVRTPDLPPKVTVISAGAANQIASWEQDGSSGLFTKYFLLGMSGEADKAPNGNGDGLASLDELDRYLKETVTYYARRYYGRDQNAQIHMGGAR